MLLPSLSPSSGKGIETVRRDGCAVVSKVLETALKILFRTKDVSLVKNYVQRQMAKTIDGRTPMQVGSWRFAVSSEDLVTETDVSNFEGRLIQQISEAVDGPR